MTGERNPRTANDASTVRVRAKVARKLPSLPRFVVIPASAVAAWGLTGTTTVGVALDGVEVEARTIKAWGPDRWFVSITQRDCDRLGIDTGARVDVALSRRDDELPGELASLLATDAAASRAWAALTPAQRRMVRDHVARAKRSETRASRARKALG